MLIDFLMKINENFNFKMRFYLQQTTNDHFWDKRQ